MEESSRNLDSLFLAALEIESPEQRSAYLDDACGLDLQLRREVERLLESNQNVGSFLELPAPELEAAVAYPPDGNDRLAAINAGLAAAFDVRLATVLGHTGMSVLKNLSETIEIPRVTLRDSENSATKPIPKDPSVDLSDRDADSRYQLQGEIARGGMGAILKGRDTDLGRELAIKVLLDSHKDKPEVVQRFIEEAQIGGQLQHPGIAPVYELGQFADRRLFFSMKLVKGETLSKLLANREASAVDRAKFVGIFQQVCQTVGYAHSRGVIHRDLKPANIMVGAFGEVQVMDWGLAKVLQSTGVTDEKKSHGMHQGTSIRTLRNNVAGTSGFQTVRGATESGPSGADDTPRSHLVLRSQPRQGIEDSDRPKAYATGSQTIAGSVMGTPAYMPPEQALGEVDLMDERADVFGLGAILCEILTGKPPYVGDDGTVIYRMAARGQLDECFERLDACGADAELVAIAKECVSPEPMNRPRDAGVLSERITKYLASVESRLRETELNRAAETARAEEALRTVAETNARAKAEARAKRLQLVVAMIALLAVSIGGLMAMLSARRQRELADAEVDARQKADEARRKADQLLEEAVASAVREQRLAAEARDAQKREGEMRNLAEEREQITQATLYAAQMNLAAQAADEPAGLRRVGEIVDAWKPDRVARDLRGWEWYYLDSLRHLARKSPPNHNALGTRWSPDGKRYVTFGRDHMIRVWNAETDALQFEARGHSAYVYEVAWNPAGTMLVSASRDHTVRFWDAQDGSPIGASIEFPDHVNAVRWNSDGKRIAVKTDREAAVCSVENRQVIRRWPSPGGEVYVSWHPKLDWLAVPRAVLDVQTGETLWSHWGEYVEWSPDGTQLAVSGFDRATILAAEDGREQLKIIIPDSSILSMSWSPKGDALALGMRDSTVRVWNTLTGQPFAVLRGNSDYVRDVAWNHDGTKLASTSFDSIKLWDWPARTNPAVIPTIYPLLSEVGWTPDGKSVMAGSDRVLKWDRDSSANQSNVLIGSDPITSGWSPAVSWSHAAGLLAARREGKLVVLDANSGESRLEIPGEWGSTRSLALNADGTRLATSAYRTMTADREEHGEICLFNTASGGIVWQQKLHGDRAGGLAWSPDGKRLACNGWTSLEILNAKDGRSLVLYDMAKDLGWLHDMQWSPDGERLVVACMNHTLRIVDARSGRELRKLVGHTGEVRAVSWSPDGQRIASGGDDKTVRIWNAQSGLQVLVLKQHQSNVESVAWSPDGKQLASGSSRGEVLVWDARSGVIADGFARSPAQPTATPAAPETLASSQRQLEQFAKQLAVDENNQEVLLARASLLARLGRWSESADTHLRLTKISPTSRFHWGMAATPMLMAGETDRYREHCLTMVEQFRGATAADVADTVCKTALLRPGIVPLSDLPILTIRDGVNAPQWEPYRTWFVACCALISYREGQFDEAIRWTTRMPTFQSQPGALALVVRAMSELRLGQVEAARESLKAAELQIPLVLRTLGAEGDSTALPVPVGSTDHDWLVPELLRREASALLK